ncbi:putative inorganic phosphate cotransporter [Penaeus japonicus]|uniref:putative inorganic phosphate cotransporter n=1 Tax=Penaeus japonicus TaxID=27405 RepID=UPI001C70C199|nr:putative inorganic phosphate cotransporter [Penaeus japonicus]
MGLQDRVSDAESGRADHVPGAGCTCEMSGQKISHQYCSYARIRCNDRIPSPLSLPRSSYRYDRREVQRTMTMPFLALGALVKCQGKKFHINIGDWRVTSACIVCIRLHLTARTLGLGATTESLVLCHCHGHPTDTTVVRNHHKPKPSTSSASATYNQEEFRLHFVIERDSWSATGGCQATRETDRVASRMLQTLVDGGGLAPLKEMTVVVHVNNEGALGVTSRCGFSRFSVHGVHVLSHRCIPCHARRKVYWREEKKNPLNLNQEHRTLHQNPPIPKKRTARAGVGAEEQKVTFEVAPLTASLWLPARRRGTRHTPQALSKLAESPFEMASFESRDFSSLQDVKEELADNAIDEYARLQKGESEAEAITAGKCEGATERGRWRVRNTLAFVGFASFALASAVRVSLSVAIVAMVRPVEAAAATVGVDGNATDAEVCHSDGTVADATGRDAGGEFAWDERTQGLVLGSYFYGYVVTNVAGGRAAERLGGRTVFGVGLILSAALTLLAPTAARLSTGLFVAVRALVGAASGVLYPATNTLLSLWIPPAHRTKFSTIVFAGMDFGTVVSLPLSGWLCEQAFLDGWPLVFYAFGGLGLASGVAWLALVSDFPEDHPHISLEEKADIKQHSGAQSRKPGPFPWRSMMTSLPVWSLIIVHVGHNWGSYTLMTQIPTYLKNIQHFDMKSNGLLSALPYLAMWLFSMSFSMLMDAMSSKLSLLSIRRISMAIACYGPMFGLVAMCFVNCDGTLAMAVLCTVVGISGSLYSGYMCSHQDLAPNFAGTLFGVTNTLANIPGFAAPQLTGAITNGNQTLSAWRRVFLLSSAIYFVTGTIYLLFISAEVQPWNEPRRKEKKEEGDEMCSEVIIKAEKSPES